MNKWLYIIAAGLMFSSLAFAESPQTGELPSPTDKLSIACKYDTHTIAQAFGQAPKPADNNASSGM